MWLKAREPRVNFLMYMLQGRENERERGLEAIQVLHGNLLFQERA